MKKDKRSMPTMSRISQAAAAFALGAPLMLSEPLLAQGTNPLAAHQGATAGYHAAMEKMNRDMAAEASTGNADRDFASMMAKHHRCPANPLGSARAEERGSPQAPVPSFSVLF